MKIRDQRATESDRQYIAYANYVMSYSALRNASANNNHKSLLIHSHDRRATRSLIDAITPLPYHKSTKTRYEDKKRHPDEPPF